MTFSTQSFTHFSRGVLLASLASLWVVLADNARADALYVGTAPSTQAIAVTIEHAITASSNNSELHNLYRTTSFQPLWYGGSVGKKRVTALVAFVERLVEDGLNAHDYILPAQPANHPLAAAAYDLAMSITLLTVIEDVTLGQTSADELGIEVDIARDNTDVATIAKQVLAASDMATALESLLPSHRHYSALRAALRYYNDLAETGGWPQVPDDMLLRAGAINSRVGLLRKRLAIENGNGLLLNTATPHLFDEELERAVIDFQRKYGLEDDGVVGRESLAALNVTARQRAGQIAINLERWRWLPRELGERHVLVNSADFTLALYENDKPTLDMRVIVGKTYRQTPILSKPMQYMVLNPTWTVPPRILRKDILPKVKIDPTYLQSKGMQVFDGWDADAALLEESEIDWSRVSSRNSPYKVRQAPGAQNALGQIKFMFPNQHSVYLHDTPTRGLFSERVRTFSSGCVRVEHPFALASALLGNNGEWASDELQSTLSRGETTNVVLTESVPVHLVYLTAWVNESGQLQFRDDVYNRDANLQLVLNKQITVAEKHDS